MSWAVFGPDGASPIEAQLVPASPADVALRTQYYGATATSNMSWVAFFAPTIPAHGYTVVFLTPVAATDMAPLTHGSVISAGAADATLSNGIFTLTFEDGSGLLTGYASTAPGVPPSLPLKQQLLYYSSNIGGVRAAGKERCSFCTS